MARLTAEALKTKLKRPPDVMQGDGSFVETRPSKGELIWSILGPYITEPVTGALNWTRDMMNADPYTILTDTGPRAQALAEGGAEVATTFTGAGSVASKPAGAITAGLGRPDKKLLTPDVLKNAKTAKVTFSDIMKTAGVTDERDMKEVAKAYGNVTRLHPKDWEYEFRDLGNIQRPPGVFDPEQAVRDNATFMQLYGDKSPAGRELVSINGQRLREPVQQQGGNEFIYGPNGRAQDPAAWASLPGSITTLSNRAKAAPIDGPLYGVYSAMGPEGIDFSNMPLKSVLGLMGGNSMSMFDDVDGVVKAAMKTKVAEKYPGLATPEGRTRLLSSEDGMGTARSLIMKKLDTADWKDTGLPDMATIRWANTDPGLVDVPNGMTGRSIARIDHDGRRIVNLADPHETYPHGLAGTPVPGYDMDIPPDIWFSDTYRPRLKKLGIDTLGEKQLPSTELRLLLTNDLKQRATPQWLDTLMTYRRGVEEGKIAPLTGPRAKPLKGRK